MKGVPERLTSNDQPTRIWTHNMKSIHVHEVFKPHTRGSKNTETGHMAATLGAGVRDGELFDAMIKENLIAVGGTNQVRN